MKTRIANWKDNATASKDADLELQYTPRWPLIVHFVCAIFCFSMSSIYHLFKDGSKEMMTFFVRFDYAGICFMIAGSATPPVYYSFACEQQYFWRTMYLTVIYGFGITLFFMMMLPYFDQDHLVALRFGLFLAFGLSCLIPLFHAALFVDQQYIHQLDCRFWILGSILYILGGCFFSTCFPEKNC